MKNISKLNRGFAVLLGDESGAEVIEYALVLGIIIVAAISTIGAVGTRVLARWASVNSSM